jgi:catechol 2,3-dioxygenase-like lactoylglutathione lyase family enzyme
LIEKVCHITFPVSDLRKAIAFYESILGLKKTGEWPNYATFDVGGLQFGLEPSKRFEIFLLVDDVDKAYRDLNAQGVKFITEPKDQHWGARSATFMDPDGNKFTIETFKNNAA